MISIIVAISTNNAIGIDNKLPWRLPNDMKRFKELTTGHTVIMGRKTFESLPKGALPNRRNIVITNNKDIVFDNCIMENNLLNAIHKYESQDDIFIIGGSSIYKQTLELADKLYITLVHQNINKADTFFPKIDENEWLLTENEEFQKDEKHLYPYAFQTFIKKK